MKILLSIILGLSISVVAQQPEPDKSQRSPAAPIIKATADLERVKKALVGSWSVSSSIESNDLRAAGAALGTAEIYTGSEGLSVGQQYRTIGPSGEFVGTLLMWWDEKEKGFRQVWCDNLSGCRVSSGVAHWDGDVLTGSQIIERLGRTWEIRQCFKDIQPDSFVYEEEIGPAGGELKRAMTVIYTRHVVAPHRSKAHISRR